MVYLKRFILPSDQSEINVITDEKRTCFNTFYPFPVLIEGYLEASYPSSTTMLVACVMPTAIMQLRDRIKNPTVKKTVFVFISAFIAFMVIGRIISGVHWISDIIGGVLLSVGLVSVYYSLAHKK